MMTPPPRTDRTVMFGAIYVVNKSSLCDLGGAYKTRTARKGEA